MASSCRECKICPFNILDRVERGKLDPGLKRFQQLLPYQVPMQAAGDLLDLEDLAGKAAGGAGPSGSTGSAAPPGMQGTPGHQVGDGPTGRGGCTEP